MKKRILFIMLLVVLLSLLCSCSCNHKWTDATCTTPKTCEKCAEIDGEALGHSFAEATCDAPKTCTLCGLTEGEALAHNFGQWTIGGEEMTRECQICQLSETQPLDREVYFHDIMVGHWDLLVQYYYGSILVPAYSLEETIGFYIRAAEDGSIYLANGDQSYDLTWEFTEYAAKDGVGGYYFTFNDEANEPFLGGILMDDAGEITMALYVGEHLIMLHKPEQLADYMEGTWACYQDEQLYTLVLNGDRTFTGNFDGEVSGTWHLTSLREEEGDGYTQTICMVKLRYMKDGAPIVDTAEIYFSYSIEELEEYVIPSGEHFDILNLSISNNYDFYSYYFTYKGDMDAPSLEAIMEEGKTAILGDWTSVELTTFVSNEATTSPDTSFHAAFHEDGTFTLFLDEEITGTWMLEDWREHWGVYHVLGYSYILQTADEDAYIYYCEVSSEQPDTMYITRSSGEFPLIYLFAPAE